MFQSNLGLNMVEIGIFGEKVRNPVPCSVIVCHARIVARHDEHAFIARQASNPARHSERPVMLRQASNPTRHGERPVIAHEASCRARHNELCCDRLSHFLCLRSVLHGLLWVDPWVGMGVNYIINEDLWIYYMMIECCCHWFVNHIWTMWNIYTWIICNVWDDVAFDIGISLDCWLLPCCCYI